MSFDNRGAVNYFSRDFEWDQLREEVENDSSLQFHTIPYPLNAVPIQIQDSIAWENFHSRHSTGKFFKERQYLLQEFPELASSKNNSTILEVGCGNGSTILPILRGREGITVYACDCSNEALDRTKEIIHASNSISSKNHFHLFQCEFSVGFPSWLACRTCSGNSLPLNTSDADCSDKINIPTSKCCIGGVDYLTLIFTLSAVPFDKMHEAITHCFSTLKPGGLILFRDYGLYDMTMLRFKPEQRVGFREYLRSDGTRSFFFCLDTVRALISTAGFIELELEYCCVKSVNRKNGKIMKRVWVHGKFQKPLC